MRDDPRGNGHTLHNLRRLTLLVPSAASSSGISRFLPYRGGDLVDTAPPSLRSKVESRSLRTRRVSPRRSVDRFVLSAATSTGASHSRLGTEFVYRHRNSTFAAARTREHLLPASFSSSSSSLFLSARVSSPVHAVGFPRFNQSLPRGSYFLSFLLSVCLYLSQSFFYVLRVITCDRAARESTRSAVDRAIAAPSFAMGPGRVAVDLAVPAAGSAASSLHQ